MKKIKVLKIGGGVLGKIEDFEKNFPEVEKLIKREKSDCEKLIVIFSAYKGITRLLSSKAIFDEGIEKYTTEYDRLVSEGEESAVRKLYRSFSQIDEFKKRLTFIKRKDIPIITNSNFGNADIKIVNKNDILKLLENNDIIFAPGFVGINDYQQITTLGNDGSDTSAIVIASAMKCDCIIIKDTGSIFTVDPHTIDNAIRIEKMNIKDANILASLGSNILHSKGTSYAETSGVNIIIRSVDGTSETIISSDAPEIDFAGITSKKALEGVRISVVGKDIPSDIAYDILKNCGYKVEKSHNPYKGKASSVMLKISEYIPSEAELETCYERGEMYNTILKTIEKNLVKKAISEIHKHFA